MTTDVPARPVSTVMHVRCPDRLPEEIYRQVLEQLAQLSPVVQALPPTAALVELKGALRYHGTDARHLGEVLRVRTLSRLGVDVRVGIGPSITVAATASAQVQPSGGVLAIAPEQAAGWLAGLPVEFLPGWLAFVATVGTWVWKWRVRKHLVAYGPDPLCVRC